MDAEINYLENPSFPDEQRGEIFYRPSIVAVASAPFKRKHPEVVNVHDLVELPLIHERSTRQWENWFEHAGKSPAYGGRGYGTAT